jgi:hypothetical protein
VIPCGVTRFPKALIALSMLAMFGCGRLGFSPEPVADSSVNDGRFGPIDGPETRISVSELQVKGSLEVNADIHRLKAVNNLLFAATSRGGGSLIVFDISSGTPVEVGSALTNGAALDVTYQEPLAFVTTEAGGDDLEIFSVANVSNITKLGGISLDDRAMRVAVQGNVAFVTSRSPGEDLTVFDVSLPNAIRRTSGLDFITAEYAAGLAIKGNLAYVGGYQICVVDISNPNAVSILNADLQLYFYAREFIVKGQTLYTLQDNNGGEEQLRTFELTNPVIPSPQISRRIASSNGRAMQVVSEYAFVVNAPSGGASSQGPSDVEVFDMTAASEMPVAKMQIQTDGLSIAVSNGVVYVGTPINDGAELHSFTIVP